MKAHQSQAGNPQIAPLISTTRAIKEYGLSRRILMLLIERQEISAIRLHSNLVLLRRGDLDNLRTKKEPR